MTRTIVSILIHPVDRRDAHCLLLYHNRVESDEIVSTTPLWTPELRV
jgi:hypothetical protein